MTYNLNYTSIDPTDFIVNLLFSYIYYMLLQRPKTFSEIWHIIDLHKKTFHISRLIPRFTQNEPLSYSSKYFDNATGHDIFYAAIMCVLFNLIEINIED